MSFVTRRRFLSACAMSAAAVAAWPVEGLAQRLPRLDVRDLQRLRGDRAISSLARFGRQLRASYRDLRRHFVFEYYPWYGASPWRHWEAWDRQPPADIASPYFPRLGPYDSRSTAIIEQHARWIADAGVGAINLSWWGPGSYEDQAAPRVMDVMAAHGVQVTFHMEPYRHDRARVFADDVRYVLREYGERRRWDGLLLLEDAEGRAAPVFKSFATIVRSHSTDCHGVTRPVPLYTPDAVWRQQIAALQRDYREDFPSGITFLADSLDHHRMQEAGFTGAAIYDSFVRPASWPGYASAISGAGLVFSFNVNPGFYRSEPRVIEPNSCYAPLPFEPPAADLELEREAERERAALLATSRITESLQATLSLQLDPKLGNTARGFFLVYLNSFNEWHEGTQFEPMKDAAALTPDERRIGYANPRDGAYRLKALAALLGEIYAG